MFVPIESSSSGVMIGFSGRRAAATSRMRRAEPASCSNALVVISRPLRVVAASAIFSAPSEALSSMSIDFVNFIGHAW
jgi:hypothetical protein